MQQSKLIIVLLLSLVLASCASTGDTVNQGTNVSNDIISAYNSFNGKVFLGVSGAYTNDEEATKIAVSNCAKMIALYEELVFAADVDIREITSLGYEYFKVKSRGVYDESKIANIISSMNILQIARGDRETGVYVLASYDGSENNNFKVNTTYSASGKPAWIDDPPHFDGYRSAVGVTKEYYYLQDSLEAAAFEGAVNIVLNHAGTLTASNELMSMSSSSSSTKSSQSYTRDLYQVNFNVLDGFTVLSYYYDKSTRTYYSLVIAKE